MPPALCPLCREPRPVQHGLFSCQKVLRFSRSIKRSIPHPLSLYQPFADGSINPYPLKHTTFFRIFVDLPGGQRNTASSHKEVCAAHRPLCTRTQVGCKVGCKNKNDANFQQISVVFHGGQTAMPDELYSLCFGIFDSVPHSTYTRDFMIGYIFSSFRYANYTKSSLRFASDLQQCLHQFRICWQNDESSQRRTVRYEQKLHNQMAQSKYPQPSDCLFFIVCVCTLFFINMTF